MTVPSGRDEPAFSGVFSGTFLSVVLLSLAGVLGFRVLKRGGFLRPDGEPRPVQPRGDLAPAEQATVALFEAASPAVVLIQSSNLRRSWGELEPHEIAEASGSGFVWDEQGHVVTNMHVVQDATLFRVYFHDGSASLASLVGTARDYDLAVLQVQAPHAKLAPLPVGRSADLRVGQSSYAIGYPFGLDQTLTAGLISGLDRTIDSRSDLQIHGVIQTDAAINPGNSGGPLLDSAGRLVGVNTAIESSTGANTGVGFAVPVDTVNRIVPRIIEEGDIERAGLGILIGDDLYAADEGLRGAVVRNVVPRGPAMRAGLQGMTFNPDGSTVLGDVIVGIDDQIITREGDLYEALEGYRAGDEVRVRLSRPGPEERRIEEVRVRLVALR